MKKIVLILLAGFMLFSCKPLTVLNDVDRSVDFTQFKTVEFYGWTDDNLGLNGSFFKNRIEKALQSEFLKRSIKTVKKGEGDLIISLFVVSEQKRESYVNSGTNYIGGTGVRPYGGYGYGGYYGYGPRYGWGGGYVQTTTTYGESVYSEGTLIVSAYDARKEELVWETVAMKTIDRNSKNPDEDITKIVAKIMTTYPIQPEK